MTAAYQHRPTGDIAMVRRRQNGGAASKKRWGLKKIYKQFLKGKSHIFRGEKLKGGGSRGSLFLVEQSKFWVSFFSSHIYCTVATRPCCTNFELNYLFWGSKNIKKTVSES